MVGRQATGGPGDPCIRGYVPGVFDLFHIGHLNILRAARLQCDWLVAGVFSDENTFRTKAKYPVVPEIERLAILEHINLVDEVILEHQLTKLDVWREHSFDVIFKGDDWQGTAKGRQLESDFSTVGVEVTYFPYTVQTSSTLLRAALGAIAS